MAKKFYINGKEVSRIKYGRLKELENAINTGTIKVNDPSEVEQYIGKIVSGPDLVEMREQAGPQSFLSLLNLKPSDPSKLPGRTMGFFETLSSGAKKVPILGSIAGGFLAPAQRAEQQLLEGVGTATMGMRGEQQKTQPFALTPEQMEAFRANPLLELGKTSAGLASYAIPGGIGGSLTNTVGRSALAGGLYGVGTSESQDPSELFGEFGKGALLGGAFGVGARGLSRGLGKIGGRKSVASFAGAGQGDEILTRLQKIENQGMGSGDDAFLQSLLNSGDKKLISQAQHAIRLGKGPGVLSKLGKGKMIRPGDVKTKLGSVNRIDRVKQIGFKPTDIKNIGGYEKAIQVSDDFVKTLDEFNLPYGTRIQRSQSLSEAKRLLSQQVDDITKSSTATFNKKNVLDSIKSKFVDNPKLYDLAETQEVISKIQRAGVGDDIAAGELHRLIQKTDEVAGGFRAISGSQSARIKRALKGVRNVLRDSLSKKVPAANVPLRKMSNLYDIEDVISMKSGQQSYLPGPQRLLGAKIPITKLADKLENLSLGLRGGKGIGSDKLAGLSSATQKLLGLKYSPMAGVYAAGGVSDSQQGGGVIGEEPYVGLDQGYGMGLGQDDMGGDMGGNIEERQALAMDLLSQGYKPSDVKTIVDLMAPISEGSAGGSRKLGKDQVNAMSGLRSIDTIEQIISDDPMAMIKVKIPGSIGARTLKTAMSNAMDVIARLRTGAAITENEEKLFMSYLPSVLDDKDTISYKLDTLRKLFSDVYERVGTEQPIGMEQGYGGYDQYGREL